MAFIIVLVAMLAIMYLLLIRPQRAKQRAAQEMLNRLAPGDEVLTVGGIYGAVVEVEEEKVVLEIAEDVHIEVSRRAIAQIIQEEPLAEAADEPGELEEADEEELVDEADGPEAEAGDEVADEIEDETAGEVKGRSG